MRRNSGYLALASSQPWKILPYASKIYSTPALEEPDTRKHREPEDRVHPRHFRCRSFGSVRSASGTSPRLRARLRDGDRSVVTGKITSVRCLCGKGAGSRDTRGTRNTRSRRVLGAKFCAKTTAGGSRLGDAAGGCRDDSVGSRTAISDSWGYSELTASTCSGRRNPNTLTCLQGLFSGTRSIGSERVSG